MVFHVLLVWSGSLLVLAKPKLSVAVPGRQVAGQHDAVWTSCKCAMTLQDQLDVTVTPYDR
jgi:hypothetical protein